MWLLPRCGCCLQDAAPRCGCCLHHCHEATLTLCAAGMVSYLKMSTSAPFSAVFEATGMQWASKVVAVGALIGCCNSNYGGLLGQSRIFVTISRAGLLPKFLSRMSSRAVPIWSIVASGLIAGLLSLFLAINQVR